MSGLCLTSERARQAAVIRGPRSVYTDTTPGDATAAALRKAFDILCAAAASSDAGSVSSPRTTLWPMGLKKYVAIQTEIVSKWQILFIVFMFTSPTKEAEDR